MNREDQWGSEMKSGSTWRTIGGHHQQADDNEKNMRSRRKPGSTLGDNGEIMEDIERHLRYLRV